MTDDQKKLLEDGGFDIGVRMSQIHENCPEYSKLLDEFMESMQAFQRRMFEHHENCNKRAVD